MITPMIHRQLSRSDLASLVAEIAKRDRHAGEAAYARLGRGAVDEILDSPAALDAVRGDGGAPAPLPLTLLWYIPVRAILLDRGESDIRMADYTATLPVAFVSTRSLRSRAVGLDAWWQAIDALPPGTVAQAERAADAAGMALWLAGCFPEWVARKANGPAMLRAYVTFAQHALSLAGRILDAMAPDAARLWERASERAELMRESLNEVRADYLAPDAHSPEARLERFLARLSPDADRRRRSFDH